MSSHTKAGATLEPPRKRQLGVCEPADVLQEAENCVVVTKKAKLQGDAYDKSVTIESDSGNPTSLQGVMRKVRPEKQSERKKRKLETDEGNCSDVQIEHKPEEIISSTSEHSEGLKEDCRIGLNNSNAGATLEPPRKRRMVFSEPVGVLAEAKSALTFCKNARIQGVAPTKSNTIISGLRNSTDQQGVKRKACSEKGPEIKKRRIQAISSSTTELESGEREASLQITDFEAKYLQEEILGEGGFGSVYSGFRRDDYFPVAIKHIPINKVNEIPVLSNGEITRVPLEVFLMQMVSDPESAAVHLLDWYKLDQEVLLVMERPVPCVNLFEYLDGNPLEENMAKNIMKQLVEATIEMRSAGVFHRDIKSENILIQTSSEFPQVRIIDFGCGCITTGRPYSHYSGTFAYAPPEYFVYGRYEDGPTTVWQLGALLYELLDGCIQFTTQDFLHNEIEISDELSEECQDFLWACLAENKNERATLEQLQQHPWLQ